MIENFAGELGFCPPLPNELVRACVFANRNAFVRQIRSFEKQIFLLFIETGGALFKIANLTANIFHCGFQVRRRFLARFFCADFLTQPIAFGL